MAGICRVLTAGSVLLPSAGCAEPASEVPAGIAIELEWVARVETDATPERAPLASVVDIEISSDGSMFVLDGLSRTVSVFDSAGTPLRSFGGRGRGPGELEEPAGITWDPDGNLWVADLGTGRFTAFDRGGELVATFRASGPAPLEPLTLRFSGQGTLRAVGVDFLGGSLEHPTAVLIEYAVAPNVVEPARQTELPFVRWPDVFDYRTDQITLLAVVPLSPEPMFGIDGVGRLWYGDAGRGVVRRWVTVDSFDLSLGRDVLPIPVTSADVEASLENNPDIEELEARGGASIVADFLERIPDYHPQIEGFFFGDDESVWVMRSAARADDGARPTDVYDRTGALLGSVAIPLAATPRPRARSGWLAGVMRDESGVELVALYRVRR